MPGVSSSVAAKIAEYWRAGTIKALDELRAKLPPSVRELAKVPGVGPKRALQLACQLGITASELAEAAKGARLRGVAGFGPSPSFR